MQRWTTQFWPITFDCVVSLRIYNFYRSGATLPSNNQRSHTTVIWRFNEMRQSQPLANNSAFATSSDITNHAGATLRTQLQGIKSANMSTMQSWDFASSLDNYGFDDRFVEFGLSLRDNNKSTVHRCNLVLHIICGQIKPRFTSLLWLDLQFSRDFCSIGSVVSVGW